MLSDSVFATLHPSLRQVLMQRLGWRQFRDIQERVYRKTDEGGDLLIMAPTAGGKSEAAFLPVIDFILKEQPDLPACLYISPLRALINDMAARIEDILIPLHLETAVIHGDSGGPDLIWRSDPPAVIMTTPESLAVILNGPAGEILAGRIRFIIIDEVHAFASSERGAQLIAELDLLDRCGGRMIRRFGISATVGNPEEVLSWLSSGRQNRHVVSSKKIPETKEFLFIQSEEEPYQRIIPLLAGKKTLIFVSGRGEAERAAELMRSEVRHLFVHHSSLSPEVRSGAEDAFESGDSAVIISTSSLELGIDIGSLDMVIQIGSPSTVSSFLQRLGRSGRREHAARMIFVWKDPEDCARICAVIEAASRGEVEEIHPPSLPFQVIVQQILLIIRHTGRIAEHSLLDLIHGLFPFRDIPYEEIEQIISHCIMLNVLIRDSLFLLLGPEGERWFTGGTGEIYSVIAGRSSMMIYTDQGDLIGNADAASIGSLGGSSFSLGGKSWLPATSTNSSMRVKPSGRSEGRLFWSGESAGTSLILMQSLARLLHDGISLPFPQEAENAVNEFRSRFPQEIHPGSIVIRTEGKEIILYTCVGEIWNNLLEKYLVSRIPGIKCVHTDMVVRVKGKNISPAQIHGILVSPKSARILMERIQVEERRWKFGKLIPPSILRKMWGVDHLDIPGFIRYLSAVRILTL